MGQIFEAYNKRLFKAGAMDFDDLLFNTNILLRDHPEVLLKYQDKFRYILVDEYQDTNFSQYVIVKQLAARFLNLCVVGDDAQSIYAFRGANIQNILNFAKDYPDYREFKLEQNYRSTQTIVEVANKVISHNKDQFKKNVWTQNDAGEKIKVIRASTDNEEGAKVASAIFHTKMNQQLRNRDFAILYRTNAQSRSMEEALRKLNIPYRIYGGISFYQRKEVKDLLAYYRLAINNHDDESLRRIINYPARGIGQSTLDKITVAAADNDVSMWTVLDNLRDFNLGLNAGITAKIGDFLTLIKSFSHQLPYKDAFETGNYIAVHSGILKDLYSDKTPEGLSRYENIQELLNGIKDFVESTRSPQEQELKESITENSAQSPQDLFEATVPENRIRTLDEFMQDISLLTDADKEQEEEKDADKVSLMTIHAAKGLEFPYVHIVGLEENLFPSQMSLNSRADREEGRRLFYVSLRGAEKTATLSYAGTRYRFGNLIYCEPSRFMDELDSRYVDFPEDQNEAPTFGQDVFGRFRDEFTNPAKKINFGGNQGGFKKNSGNTNASSNSSMASSVKKNLVSLQGKKTPNISTPVDMEMVKNLKPGDRVEHEKFGQGKVLLIEGVFPNLKASVHFGSAGEKQLLLKFARLRLLV